MNFGVIALMGAPDAVVSFAVVLRGSRLGRFEERTGEAIRVGSSSRPGPKPRVDRQLGARRPQVPLRGARGRTPCVQALTPEEVRAQER